MKHLDALLLSAFLLAATSLSAQQRPTAPKLLLASGTVAPPANFSTWTSTERPAAAELWHGQYYRILQFDQLPTAEQHRALKAQGVLLLQYLPQNAYVAALPATLDRSRLQGFGIRSVVSVQAQWKYAMGLTQEGPVPAHAQRPGGRVAVVVQYHPTIKPDEAAAELRAAGYELVQRLDYSQQVEVTLPRTALAQLAAKPWVATVEYVAPPAEPENQRGRTNHRANVLAADYGAGRHYDGTGVNVAHGDDGAIGPHIDYQGRLDQSSAGPSLGNHGDHVAGIIMGAGNLDPRYRGQATGAFNYYYNYPNNINSAPQHYNTRNIRITSSSYGDGNNAGYTSFTRSVDLMTRQMPLLLHVFSSGNDGGSNFNYGAGAGWGNITGGHKQGKNVITVGNVTYQDALAASSSRGPAHDGRLKPEVCALGTSVTSTVDVNTYAVFTGTSMACPAVSGVVAQLMHAHKQLNAGAEAPGALLKAALMNTAEDLGNVGPDYRYGYGRINALRAVRVLEQHSYQSDSLTQGQTRAHTITVPAGQKQLRVMLYWHDYEAAANARKALVNNLDLTLAAPGGTSFQPWILDPTPRVTALNSMATRGVDTLNNSEQVTLDNPVAGTYTLTINGTAVPQGKQGYVLVYSWLNDDVEMTYPVGGEAFVPGETEAVRWDAAPGTDPFVLEYTTNNGATWTAINNNIAATARTIDWVVPAGLSTGQARLRVRRGTNTDESDANFSISAVPANLRTSAVCRTGTTLAWDAVAGATSYEVFELGAKYMQPVSIVTTTSAVVPYTTGEAWYAVRALGANDLRSRRTRAITRPSGLSNCNDRPLALFTPNQRQICVNTPVTLQDQSQLQPTSWQWSVTPSAGVTFVNGTSATSQNPQLQFSTPGTYSVTLTASNSFGNDLRTEPSLLTVVNIRALPLGENFAGTTFPPAEWQVLNPSGNFTWQLSPVAVVTPDGVSRRVAMANDYADPDRGAEDYLLSPPLNVQNTTNQLLEFWVAYRTYSAAYNDGLRVDYSTDCGLTFQPTGYLKRGSALATVPLSTSSNWAPGLANQWRRETIDLKPLLGTITAPTKLIVRFVNLNDNGQNLYLTNVQVADQAITAARKSAAEWPFAVYPVPFGNTLTVQLQAPQRSAATLLLTDALGRTVQQQDVQLSGQAQQLTMPTDALPTGVYTLHLLSADGHSQTMKVIK